jgi:hypothetical protein
MKMNNTKALIWTLLMSAASIYCTPAVWADAPAAAVKSDSGRSVFVIPSNPKEGCDPFYPDSNRLFESIATQPKHGFAAGEEGDVLTAQGVRVHLRCIEIKRNSVLVESGGQRQELTFLAK